MIRKVILILSALAGLAACAKIDESVFEVSPDNIVLLDGQSVGEITIRTGASWNIEGVPSWLNLSMLSGTGSATIRVTLTNINSSDKDRSCNLTISGSTASKTITVTNPAVYLHTDMEEYCISEEEGTASIMITSSTEWRFDIPDNISEWCDIEPSSGTGDAEVVLTVKDGAERKTRESLPLGIIYGNNYTATIYLTLQPVNTAPSVPAIIAPADKTSADVSSAVLEWETSEDADGDPVSYKVSITSVQPENGEIIPQYTIETSDNRCAIPGTMAIDGNYWWQVEASDGFGGCAVSGIASFTLTASAPYYSDMECSLYQDYESSGNPVNIVVLGDGFVNKDYLHGGYFDQVVENAVTGFFDIEPFKTFRHYFRIYKVAAYSSERGATMRAENINRNTVFGTTLAGGSSTNITASYNNIYEAAKRTGLDDEDLKKTLIIMLVNVNKYAGTCYMQSDGKAIAMCAIDSSRTDGLKRLINHEAGGHGFGRLSDEYIVYNRAPDANDVNRIRTWNTYPSGDVNKFYTNISFISNASEVEWNTFIGRPEYPKVGVFEGAYWSVGAYKCESSANCMIYNDPYYNAVSRYAIYRRIKSTAGEEYSVEDFMSIDIHKTQQQLRHVKSDFSVPYEEFIPLGEPILIEIN